MPLRTFVLSILSSRGLRYLVEGILAVRYGDAALRFMISHSVAFGMADRGGDATAFSHQPSVAGAPRTQPLIALHRFANSSRSKQKFLAPETHVLADSHAHQNIPRTGVISPRNAHRAIRIGIRSGTHHSRNEEIAHIPKIAAPPPFALPPLAQENRQACIASHCAPDQSRARVQTAHRPLQSYYPSRRLRATQAGGVEVRKSSYRKRHPPVIVVGVKQLDRSTVQIVRACRCKREAEQAAQLLRLSAARFFRSPISSSTSPTASVKAIRLQAESKSRIKSAANRTRPSASEMAKAVERQRHSRGRAANARDPDRAHNESRPKTQLLGAGKRPRRSVLHRDSGQKSKTRRQSHMRAGSKTEGNAAKCGRIGEKSSRRQDSSHNQGPEQRQPRPASPSQIAASAFAHPRHRQRSQCVRNRFHARILPEGRADDRMARECQEAVGAGRRPARGSPHLRAEH